MFDANPRKVGVQDQKVAGLWAPKILVSSTGSRPGTPEMAPWGATRSKNFLARSKNYKALHIKATDSPWTVELIYLKDIVDSRLGGLFPGHF
jgi:hypothetical protein